MTALFRPTNQEITQSQRLQEARPYHLPELTIYITDTCSMSCSGCITFNNLALGSHRRLDDQVRTRMTSWAGLCSVEQITILGGEPLQNPELDSWMALVEELWPQSRHSLVTNGLLLESRTEEICSWIERGWDLEVSSHTPEHYEQALAWWQTLLAALEQPARHRIIDDDEGRTHYWEDHEGRPMMQIGERWQFYQSLFRVEEGQIHWGALTSARRTWNLCPARECRHLVDGVMYRCPIQALMPTLNQRFEIAGPAGELASLDLGFDPLEPRSSLSLWMQTLNTPQKQCSLCEWPRPRQVLEDPTAKKIRVIKRDRQDNPTTAQELPANP